VEVIERFREPQADINAQARFQADPGFAIGPQCARLVFDRVDFLAGGDIIAELFKPLPSMVVAHYLGVPDADRAQFDGWTDAIVAASASGPAGVISAGDAVLSMMA
jgi:cytochrome P450